MNRLVVLWSALAFSAGVSTGAGGCVCQGCGCKGGPGWRDQQGRCVSEKKLKAVCGDPPTRSCSYEGASQVCRSERRTLDPPTKQEPGS